MDIEARRAEAKSYRGVGYDARTDRFTAEIIEAGRRRWLGSYSTAQEAADVYEAAKSQAVVVRPRSEKAFAQVYAAFRDKHGGDRAAVPEGAVMTYAGQQFVAEGLTWRAVKGGKVAGRKFAFLLWRSKCSQCGVDYVTMTPAPVSVAKGITRNCPEHRQAKRKAAKLPKQRETMGEVAAGIVEGLSCLHASLLIREVAEAIVAGDSRVQTAEQAERLLRMMASDGRGWVVLRGDTVLLGSRDLL